MYLKSIEINGFKSFAKKAELHFSSSITAIVGPNGSGKSNVAEAFRFVLGEQSVKSLRGKRGEDLIWNGSNDIPRQNRASVKLVFDNSNKIFNIDYDEVSIERTVHRDSQNEYLINGSAVRLKDIVELLAGAHIGASGHHIISQGEADRILSANIEERKAMVEDALGLKIFQYKKTESLRKLEKTEDNMREVEGLRRELAPHLKFLRKQVEKAEQVEVFKNKLRDLYKIYLKQEETYIAKEKQSIKNLFEEPLRSLELVEANIKRVKEVLESSKANDEKSLKLGEIERLLSETKLNKDRYLREESRLSGEISAILRLIKREENLLLQAEQKPVPLNEIVNLKDTTNELISGAENESNLESLKNILNKIKSLFSEFIDSKRQKNTSLELDNLKLELDKLLQDKDLAQKELDKYTDLERQHELSYSSLREQIEKDKDNNRDAEKELFSLISRQNEFRNIINSLKSREDSLKRIEDDFRRELEEAYVLCGRNAVSYSDYVLGAEMTLEERIVQEGRRKDLEKLKIRIEDMGGAGGSEILSEYKNASERDEFLTRELKDLEDSALKLREIIVNLDKELASQFATGIDKINGSFKEYFTLLFGGGEAKLDIIREKKKSKKSLFGDDSEEIESEQMGEENNDSSTEYREGIDIAVSLPRKRIKGLTMLSGGERALTSIALLFAISEVNPPPFVILDETDAALDEANSRKYADMIENLSKHSELILITHNRETMSRAGVLYGVTMGADGSSKLLSIQFEEAVKVAK